MKLDTIVETVGKLPPTPQILPKLQTLLRDENSGMQDIVQLLKVDAPMTAQVVRLSNSAFFGAGQPSQSLEEAIHRLGFNEVYKVVSMAATNRILGGEQKTYKMAKGELLALSTACAVLMAELASEARRDVDAAYTVGLLHPIGKVVINEYFLQRDIEVYSEDEPLDLLMEKRTLGFDHAEAGAALLRKWKFPDEVTIPIECQYRPLEALSRQPETCRLALARSLAPIVIETAELPQDFTDELLEPAEVSLDTVRECVMNAHHGYGELKSLIA